MIPGRRRDVNDPGVVNSVCQEAWLPGVPKRELMRMVTAEGNSLAVTTYACPECGLLQSYINPTELPDTEL